MQPILLLCLSPAFHFLAFESCLFHKLFFKVNQSANCLNQRSTMKTSSSSCPYFVLSLLCLLSCDLGSCLDRGGGGLAGADPMAFHPPLYVLKGLPALFQTTQAPLLPRWAVKEWPNWGPPKGRLSFCAHHVGENTTLCETNDIHE